MLQANFLSVLPEGVAGSGFTMSVLREKRLSYVIVEAKSGV
jgi:hypothetical protein